MHACSRVDPVHVRTCIAIIIHIHIMYVPDCSIITNVIRLALGWLYL